MSKLLVQQIGDPATGKSTNVHEGTVKARLTVAASGVTLTNAESFNISAFTDSATGRAFGSYTAPMKTANHASGVSSTTYYARHRERFANEFRIENLTTDGAGYVDAMFCGAVFGELA